MMQLENRHAQYCVHLQMGNVPYTHTHNVIVLNRFEYCIGMTLLHGTMCSAVTGKYTSNNRRMTKHIVRVKHAIFSITINTVSQYK